MNDIVGVHRVEIPGRWLAGGELFVCVVQPDPPPLKVLKSDASRPDALALAEQLFKERIGHWRQGTPALIVFPELTFGSLDYERLDDWVARLSSPTIVLAGFGFCSGERLEEILGRQDRPLEPTWPRDEAPLEPEGAYNCGWCWIRGPGESFRRLVFIKNYAQQEVEIAEIEGWTDGSHILRLDTEDLSLFPLICADVICNKPKSPRQRIRDSIDNDKSCDRRKVLVAALLYSENSHSPFWKTSLNDLAAADGDSRLATLLVNLAQPPPRAVDEEDAWRSLTGAFLHRGRMDGPPKRPLNHVRYVDTDSVRGMVLRLTRPGTAEGTLRWRCGPDLGAAVWMPDQRRLWINRRLKKVGAWTTSSELSRFIARNKQRLPENPHERLRPVLCARLERLEQVLDEDPIAAWISNLWPRLLYGLEEVSAELSNPDHLHRHDLVFRRALIILAALNTPGLAPLVLERVADAQLLMEHGQKHYVMIWHHPDMSVSRQTRNLQHLVDESGRRGLLVIGAGKTGYEGAKRIESPKRISYERRSDISRGAVDPLEPGVRRRGEHRLRGSRTLRPVYWFPLQEFENVLYEENWDTDDVASQLDRRLKDLIGTLLEKAEEGVAA